MAVSQGAVTVQTLVADQLGMINSLAVCTPPPTGTQRLQEACQAFLAANGQGSQKRAAPKLAGPQPANKKASKPPRGQTSDSLASQLPQYAHVKVVEPGRPYGVVCAAANAAGLQTEFLVAFGAGIRLEFDASDGSGPFVIYGFFLEERKGVLYYLPVYREDDFRHPDKMPASWAKVSDKATTGKGGQTLPEAGKVRWGAGGCVSIHSVWEAGDKRLVGRDGPPEEVIVSNKVYTATHDAVRATREIQHANVWEPTPGMWGDQPFYFRRLLDEDSRTLVDLQPSPKALLEERCDAGQMGAGRLLAQITLCVVVLPLQAFFRELKAGLLGDHAALRERAGAGCVLRMPFPVLAAIVCEETVVYQHATRRWCTTCASVGELEKLFHMDAQDLGRNIDVSIANISAGLQPEGGPETWELAYCHGQPGLACVRWVPPLG